MSPRLLSPLERYFNEATQRILDSQWMSFNRASQWRDVLPCPDVSTLAADLLPDDGFRDLYALILREPKPTEREKQLRWENLAMQFFNDYQQRVRRNINDMRSHLTDELAVWNRNHPEKNEQLPFEETHREWLANVESLSLREFSKLRVGADTASQFLNPKFNALIEKYGMLEGRKRKDEQQLKPATVFIVNSARASLFHELAKFIDEVDHNNLSDLINGEPISTFITANCTQNTLGRILHKAYQNGSIQASKAILAKWLCQHFKRRTNGELFLLTESTMLRHLSGLGYNVN